MKTIGLLGGMSWESTTLYYQGINQRIQQRLGGLHSAKILLYSFDFYEIEQLQLQGLWKKAGALLGGVAAELEKMRAECLVICSNTMHKVLPQIVKHTSLPVIHIADATAYAVCQDNIKSVGLLGTNFTMEQEFYRARLRDQFGLQVILPLKSERNRVNEIIYQELVRGDIRESSRQEYRAICAGMQSRGAEAIIAGCTEIASLIRAEDLTLPFFDTTQIHIDAVARFALGED